MCHLFLIALLSFITKASNSRVTHPVDTGRKLIVHKTFRRGLMYVQSMSCIYRVAHLFALRGKRNNKIVLRMRVPGAFTQMLLTRICHFHDSGSCNSHELQGKNVINKIL